MWSLIGSETQGQANTAWSTGQTHREGSPCARLDLAPRARAHNMHEHRMGR